MTSTMSVIRRPIRARAPRNCGGWATTRPSSTPSWATATIRACPRTTLLAHVVYACDEMSGFVIAVAYVRPNRSLDEVDVRSVVKKMRDKGFARQVPRDQLEKGAVELDLPLEEHIANVIAGLGPVREALGI